MPNIEEPMVPSEPQTTPRGNKARKKKIIIGTLLVFFIIVSIAGIGVAARVKSGVDKFREHGPFGFMMERVVKDLNLTEQQKKEVDAIRDEVKAKTEQKRKDRQSDAQQMEDLFRSGTFDKQKALELASKRDADKEEMRNFYIEELAKFHAILTPDQRNKAADKMKEFREKRSNFFRDGKRNKDGHQPDKN